MAFLLNPNIAYLLLVLGFLLALLALITPGTGLLELGAIFSFIVPGYVAYRDGINWWALVLLLVSLAPFYYSTRKPRREVFLVISILLIVAGSLYLFPSGSWIPTVHPLVAGVVSLLATLFIWFVVRKTASVLAARPAQDLQALISMVGETKTRVHESGSVQVGGELWTARSEKVIPAGKAIRVVGREGFVLVIETADHPN
jgi:membrane-bound serine protease (ClpP class)